MWLILENPTGKSTVRKKNEKDRKHRTHRDTLPRFVWRTDSQFAISSHWEYAIAFHPLDFSGRLRAGRDYIIGILQKYSVPLVFGVPWQRWVQGHGSLLVWRYGCWFWRTRAIKVLYTFSIYKHHFMLRLFYMIMQIWVDIGKTSIWRCEASPDWLSRCAWH